MCHVVLSIFEEGATMNHWHVRNCWLTLMTTHSQSRSYQNAQFLPDGT